MKKLLLLAFQLFFYKGSHTPDTIYHPVLGQIQQKTNMTAQFQSYSFFTRKKYSEPSILIGHSFGGFFALKDYLHSHKNIRGIILLNSHFNSRHKAFYPGIPQEKINIPVLTILGKKDERLPLTTSIWDLYDSKEKLLSNKFYIIENNRTHFTGLTEKTTSETIRLANIISDFIMDIDKHNFTNTKNKITNGFDFHNKSIINLNWSMNIYDALSKTILYPKFWDMMHWFLFLYSKPTDDYDIHFHDDHHVYMKTKYKTPSDISKWISSDISKWISSDNPKWISSDNPKWISSGNKKMNIIKLPTIGFSILIWLSYYLCVSNKKYDIIMLPINNHTCYYKIPNPYRIFSA